MERHSRPGERGQAGPAAELGRRIAVLAGLAETLGAIIARAPKGGALAMQRIAGMQLEIERAVARIMEAERAWDDWNNGSGGAGGQLGGGGDIDFDAARHEIGCRLARLRECCRPD
jgi:hypothetical protein